MALFSVFAYKRRPPRPIAAVMDALTAAAHVQPSYVVRAGLAPAHIHAHVLSTPTAMYAAEEQVQLGRTFTALNGYVFRPGSGAPRALTAADVAEVFADGVDLGEADRWAGDFALCHVDAAGVVTAFSDLHRAQSVFWIDTPWVFAVSTRPSLLRLLSGDSSLDAEAVAAVTASGYAVGDLTMHAGVLAVPQGAAIRWDGRAVSFLERERVVLRPAERGLEVDDSWTHDQLDAGIAEAARSIELANTSSDAIELGITGGKDSRVVLALCLAQGLGPRLRLFTRGTPDHPDVVVARLVAERAGLPHRTIEPPVKVATAAPTMPTAEEYLGRLARHGFQTDGLVGGWDYFTGTTTGTGLTVSGLMGEILKAFAKKPFDTDRRPDVATVVGLQSPYDPLGVLTPWARQVLDERLDRRFTELLDAGYTYADLPDLFYYENRIPNWLGHSRQVHTFTQTTLAPLGAVSLARVAFRATAAERKAELIHYLLLQRAAPQLLDVPFAMQTWDPSLPGAPVVEPVHAPRASEAPGRANGTWQFALWNRSVRVAVREAVAGIESDVVWRAVDRERLMAQLDGPPLGIRKIMSLLGLLPLALLADDRVDHTKLTTAGGAALTAYSFHPAQPGPIWSRVRTTDGWTPC